VWLARQGIALPLPYTLRGRASLALAPATCYNSLVFTLASTMLTWENRFRVKRYYDVRDEGDALWKNIY